MSGLSPAWFSLVMATGIVSIAAYVQDIPYVPTFLMWANIVFYALLGFLYLARMVAFPRAFFGDLLQHMSAMGYFTIVAGTGVLGAQLLQVGKHQTAAQILWVTALLFWLLLVYAIPVALMAQSEGKPHLQQGIQGNWLLCTVATASVSVLGTQLASSFEAATDQVIFWSFLIWLLSIVFYLWVIVMIVHRLFFYNLTAGELYPAYWIDMGAVAIATLAGAALLRVQVQPPLIERLEPFIIGLTLLLWITATWWIPWLFVMFVWRHRRIAPTSLVRAGLVGTGLPFRHVLGRYRGRRAGSRSARRLRRYRLGIRLDRDRRLGCNVRQHAGHPVAVAPDLRIYVRPVASPKTRSNPGISPEDPF
ncbi:MAG TPA: tellurite resistance/C4-dicarboxylate transporter family protein [Rubrobacteraceae bacterium]|nr:tellurite resistance/C4-dicarboxylate transporter family protein [Rubrobacteraceae bacterium]